MSDHQIPTQILHHVRRAPCVSDGADFCSAQVARADVAADRREGAGDHRRELAGHQDPWPRMTDGHPCFQVCT